MRLAGSTYQDIAASGDVTVLPELRADVELALESLPLTLGQPIRDLVARIAEALVQAAPVRVIEIRDQALVAGGARIADEFLRKRLRCCHTSGRSPIMVLPVFSSS